jgi:hypothetical protein
VCLMRVSHRHVSHGRIPRNCSFWWSVAWSGVAFLILALSGKLALGPIAPGIGPALSVISWSVSPDHTWLIPRTKMAQEN